jgi:prevent-host-death family protein
VRARSVSIADLKNNLSAYLGRVRHGDEILVRDRNVPIAKIVPLADTTNFDAEEEALAAEGKLRLPDGPLPASFWKRRGPRVSPADVLRAIRADRDEG